VAIKQFRSEEERSLAFGSIVAGYTIIGTAFDHPLTKIYIYNDTDARLTFSFQGSTEDHITLPTKGFILLDINSSTVDNVFLKNSSALYVKRDETPTSGSVYVTGFYSRNPQ
jgi:hypothetical protein